MVSSNSVIGGVYIALGVVCLVGLVWTYIKQPLFPFRFDRLAWTQAWLKATVLDYYGVAMPLCAIIIATDPSLFAAVAWCAGVLFLGSPVACAWVARMLIEFGTLRIK